MENRLAGRGGNIARLLIEAVGERYADVQVRDLSPALTATFCVLPDDKGVMLWGKAGVGKTHTMAVFVRSFIVEGCSIGFETWDMLCLRIRSSYQAKASETE